MSTPAQFAAKMRQLPTQIEQATETAVAKSALQMTTRARVNITSAAGGDSRLSGVGKRGAKVGARYEVKRDPHNPSALISAEGPLQLVERDTKPHEETPRRRGRGARNAAAGLAGTTPLSTPYGPRYRVQHPGTRGKHPFEKAILAATPTTPAVFQREIRAAMGRIFR